MSGMNRKRGTSIGMGLLCTGAVLASGAIASPTTDEVSVRYVAADLATAKGTEALYQRIERAARVACHRPNIGALDAYRLYRACYGRAVDAAVAQVDSSTLTSLHRARTHGSIG
jgi:UrcA family protein